MQQQKQNEQTQVELKQNEQQQDVKNALSKTKLEKDLTVTEDRLKPFWLGMIFGGGLIRTVKGVGVGFGVVAIAEPLMLHYGLAISSTFLLPACITFFGIAFFVQHFYSMQWKYQKAVDKNKNLEKLSPGSLLQKWNIQVHYYGLHIDPFTDFGDRKPDSYKKLRLGIEEFHTDLKKRLENAERQFAAQTPQNHALSAKILKMKENYLAFADHQTHLISELTEHKKEHIKWYKDFQGMGNQFINGVLGFLFGWSLFSLFNAKVGAAVIATVFPGGVAACTTLFLLIGFAVFQFNEQFFEPGFKECVDDIKKDSKEIQARTHLVDLKIRQHRISHKLTVILYEQFGDDQYATQPTQLQAKPASYSNADTLKNVGLYPVPVQLPIAPQSVVDNALASATIQGRSVTVNG
jgi:hypothetical protein